MKYYIFVIGCDMNKNDAERMSAVLSMLGLEETKDESNADFLIAICCSVRLSATNRIFGRGREWQKYHKKGAKILLTGCVLEKDKEKLYKYYDNIFPIEEINKLPEILGIKSNKEELKEYLSVYPLYESSFRAYVPIMTGCNNFCSYCAVPYVRGREKSRPKEEIIKEIKDLISNNYKEIILLGQNVNSYQDNDTQRTDLCDNKGPSFVELVTAIDKIDGDYRIYFYSNHPKDVSSELIDTLPKLKHFPNYIHLPLQSGSTSILRSMNRNYTKEDYLKLVSDIKKKIPNVAITTDVIVGYPGETKGQFQDTVDVMKKVRFNMAFTAQYSERSGTKSAKIKDNIPHEEKKKRDEKLQKVLGTSLIAINRKLVDTKQRVLIDSEKSGKYYGRTDSYKVVEIKTDQKLEIGQFYIVRISKAEAWKLFATL